MRTPHTGCWEGKRVRVTLLNGEVFIDKYDGAKGKWRFFVNHPKVAAGDIKSFVIWKRPSD
jgi:hypothetical protein